MKRPNVDADVPTLEMALLEFLDKLGGRWNLSLFHYRNHGADRSLRGHPARARTPATSRWSDDPRHRRGGGCGPS